MMNGKFLIAILLLCCILPLKGKETAEKVFITETERLRLLGNLQEMFFKPNLQPPLKNFRSDGTWSDIDYQAQTRGAWAPAQHLRRTRELASCSPELAYKALEAWVRLDPTSPNWWWGCIGVPKELCSIILILGPDKMPPELLKKLEPIIRRCYIYWKSGKKLTGQNLVWVEGIRFYTGIIYRDYPLAAEGRETILSELKIVPPGTEGLQQDFSFHQHGSQNQIGNYGLYFFEEQVSWARALAGTRLARPPEQLKLLDRYFTESLRWGLKDGLLDYGLCARQLWAYNPTSKYQQILQCGRQLAALLPPDRQTEFRRSLSDPEALTGAIAFPHGGELIYRAGDWYFSLKLCSSQLIGSETVNSENLHGKYQGDGLAFFGNLKRYRGFPVLFDQRHLPGTTEPDDRSSLLCRGIRNTRGCYAVLADYPVAIGALKMDADDLQADKVYFCTSGGVTCCGSGISSVSAAPVITTLDQYRADSEADYPVEYAGKNLKRIEEMRKGRWQDSFAEISARPVSGRVVRYVIDHGVKPQGAGYHYTMRKAGSVVPSEQLLPTSSPRIHALLAGKLILIAAFVPGEVSLPGGKKLAVTPGIAVWNENGSPVKKAEFRTR